MAAEKAITRENFRSRLRTAHNTGTMGMAGIVETLVAYEGYPDQMDSAALGAAAKFEEAAAALRRAVALVADIPPAAAPCKRCAEYGLHQGQVCNICGAEG